MNGNEYQQAAARTICDQRRAKETLAQLNDLETKNNCVLGMQLMHGVLGLSGEVGELSASLEGTIYYGKPLDKTNLAEEIGDCLWYLAELATALDVDLSKLMEANIAKLKKRFPEKFSYVRVLEENRDREEEAKTINNHL